MIKRVDVIIATRNRLEKLKQTLDSIAGNNFQVPTYVKVSCDDDYESFRELTYHPRLDDLIYINAHKGAVYCRNELLKKCEDAIIYATDDIIFEPRAIAEAIKMFVEKFPDDDGVIGFTQTGNKKFSPAGVGLVGKNFLKRYPDKQLFCPEYFHFACQEIHKAAVKLNKFYLCETAIVKHLNPFINSEYMDQTHKDARIYKSEDHLLMREREANNLIWGIND